jgi:cbb3-type cytochrome oxidase maturation protein
MDIILLLIPAALTVSGVAIVVFFWSVKSNQFEDLEGDSYRILMDDDEYDPNSFEAEQNREARN